MIFQQKSLYAVYTQRRKNTYAVPLYLIIFSNNHLIADTFQIGIISSPDNGGVPT